MRILVCVKFVPDLQSQRSFTDGRVTRTSDDGSMNELDENAVEAALQLTEAAEGEHEVIALTVGGPDAVAAVRKALQRGVTRAVHVSDEALAGSDVFGTAAALSGAIKKIHAETPLDLVITGMAALDGLTSLMPTLLGEYLEWPALTLASELEVTGDAATVVRRLPDAAETLTAALPAVVSVTDELNKPRYPNFKMIMAARQAEIPTWSLADVDVPATSVGAKAARTTVLEAAPRPPRENVEIVNDTGDGGEKLAAYLIEKGLV